MYKTTVKAVFQDPKLLQEHEVSGWVRTFRSNRFIALNDGSTLNNLQCVVDFETLDPDLLKRITTGSALRLRGTLVESQGRGQRFELQVSALDILGDADPDKYPIQPKKHTMEFLREQAHLRIRTNTFGAVMSDSFGRLIRRPPIFYLQRVLQFSRSYYNRVRC